MHLAQSCLCCRSAELDAWPAVIAPFVAERSLGSPPHRCRLLECRRCGFRFFDVRLDDAEVARLYDGYRDERYYRQRHRHEWWYSRKVNESLGGDEASVRARQDELMRFLAAHAELRGVETVVDYGGDRGQFVPPSLGRERFVFEVSGVEAVPGVRALRTEAEFADRTFDVVILSHVLEHVSDPEALLLKLARLGVPGRSIFYVEVPLERPRLGGVLRGRLGELWLEGLLHAPTILRAVDFCSTALRVAVGVVPPLGVLKAHEHLNFFDRRSLRSLLERVGFEVLAVETTGDGLGRTPVLRCAARRTVTSSRD